MQEQVYTDSEKIVADWLIRRGIPFQFQTSYAGGIYELGGSVIDFILPGNIALRVHGEYWHRSVKSSGKDLIQKENLAAMGLIVVDVWSDDIEHRLDETMNKAIIGVEMLH